MAMPDELGLSYYRDALLGLYAIVYLITCALISQTKPTGAASRYAVLLRDTFNGLVLSLSSLTVALSIPALVTLYENLPGYLCSPSIHDSLDLVYLVSILNRSIQLFEAPLHFLCNTPLTMTHVSHHFGMFCSSWLWLHYRCNLSMVLVFVNGVDNGIYYAYRLANRCCPGVAPRMRPLLKLWTQVETAAGWLTVFVAIFGFALSWESCAGFVCFALSTGIHAGVGYVLNAARGLTLFVMPLADKRKEE